MEHASEVTGQQRQAGFNAAPVNKFALPLEDQFAQKLPELGVPWQSIRPAQPEMVMLNETLAIELGLDPAVLRTEGGVRALLGNTLGPGSSPVAQVYAGHQFGRYSPRLGDGRALLLGELREPGGRLLDVHLKGSGPTPFARGGDGFAVLGPMLREYLVSEAMHAQGAPTTRALAVISTGQLVPRDGELLPGAVLVRVASSHLRVGTFQFARATGDAELLRRLVGFALERHSPSFDEAGSGSGHQALALLAHTVERQAQLVAQWTLSGFVHGVMNTDNMTISGETIDYGPCAFIDRYDPAAVFSSIDHEGRYAYGAQPAIAYWNLTRLAESLLPIVPGAGEHAAISSVREVLERFGPAYDAAWLRGMRERLGSVGASDEQVIADAGAFLSGVQRDRLDYTAAMHRVNSANPRYIPRNAVLDAALLAAQTGDLGPYLRLLDAVTRPTVERADYADLATPPPGGSRPHVTYCGT